jgi:hypothetical protein
MTMSQSSEEKNKALVLEAFETLFNKRDYAAAERYRSLNYVHSTAPILNLVVRASLSSSRASLRH